jgi:hypothetical protein
VIYIGGFEFERESYEKRQMPEAGIHCLRQEEELSAGGRQRTYLPKAENTSRAKREIKLPKAETSFEQSERDNTAKGRYHVLTAKDSDNEP